MPIVNEVTAVLLNYRRPWHIPHIVAHLRTFPQIRDILIICNERLPSSMEKELIAEFDVTTIAPDKNLCTLGRFLHLDLAKCDTIYTQDDDLTVSNIPALLDAYDGTRIVANLADDASSKHWQFWQADPKPYVELGFGSIFPREWARQFLEMKWTDDEELARRKADKAFSILFPWTAMRAGPEDITRLYHEGEESGRDANALFKRADHRAMTEKSVSAALAWKAAMACGHGGDRS